MIADALQGERFVEVTRGDRVESEHRVAACASDASGRVLFAVGEIDVPVYLRSSAKPLIAAAALREGVAERFSLTQREIAVMAASHNGESFHVEAVRSILRKIGLPETALQCGAHLPYDAASAQALLRSGAPVTAVYNNCSGKHAGILALCLAIGADPQTYVDPENPAQRLILDLCARFADERSEDLPLGVDGCGIPVYAVSLRHAALSFARVANPDGIDAEDARAIARVGDAMCAHPEYVAGTGEFDSAIIAAGRGDIVAKSGAEGVCAVAVRSRGAGLALKVVDGAGRAAAPAALAILERLELLDPERRLQLASYERPVVRNRAGRAVGSILAR